MPNNTPAETFNQFVQELAPLPYIPGTETYTPHPIKQKLANATNTPLNATWTCFLFETSTGDSSLKHTAEQAKNTLTKETTHIKNTDITITEKDGRKGLQLTTTVPQDRDTQLEKARNIGDALAKITH